MKKILALTTALSILAMTPNMSVAATGDQESSLLNVAAASAGGATATGVMYASAVYGPRTGMYNRSILAGWGWKATKIMTGLNVLFHYTGLRKFSGDAVNYFMEGAIMSSLGGMLLGQGTLLESNKQLYTREEVVNQDSFSATQSGQSRFGQSQFGQNQFGQSQFGQSQGFSPVKTFQYTEYQPATASIGRAFGFVAETVAKAGRNAVDGVSTAAHVVKDKIGAVANAASETGKAAVGTAAHVAGQAADIATKGGADWYDHLQREEGDKTD